MIKKLFIVSILIGLSVLILGCSQKSEEKDSGQYFSETDLATYNADENTDENDAISPETELEIQLKEFYEFSKKFFSIWNGHIESTTELLGKFNDKNTTLDDKIIYSRVLYEKYEKFDEDLKQITPPSEASNAYRYALNAISKRILFFKEFEKGTGMYELIEIENEAYLYETLFWEEMDKIYTNFDEMITKMGIYRDEFYLSI
jgi:hypothetical protein